MSISIAEMIAATAFNENDVVEIEQTDGVSRKLTKKQLRSLLFTDPAFATPLPLVGDTVTFASGGDLVTGPPSRWRVIPPAAYVATSPPLGISVAFNGGAPGLGVLRRATDYFQVGDPVRIEIGAGVFYYGIADDVIEFGLTIAGALLPNAPILSLAVGTPEMVKTVEMIYPDATYNDSTALPLAKGCQHMWRGRRGFLCSFSASHMNTGTTITIMPQIAGVSVATVGVLPAAGTATTRGAFVKNTLGTLIPANVDINDGQMIVIRTITITGLGDYLIVSLNFVVP